MSQHPAPHKEQSSEAVVIDVQAEFVEASDLTEAAAIPIEDTAESSNLENNTIELNSGLVISGHSRCNT